MSIHPWGRSMLALACIWLAASCSKRNEDLCCATDAECTAVGFSSHQPCALGVCVNYACTTTPGACDDDDDGDCSSTPATPTCVANTCSACATSAACPTSTPVCDATLHTCRTCTADAECNSGACDVAAGSCVDPTSILYTVADGTNAGDCTRTSPCSLEKAANTVDVIHNYIVLTDGDYTGAAEFDAKKVIIAGHEATLDLIDVVLNSGVRSGISITNGSSVWIRDIKTIDHTHAPGEGSSVIQMSAPNDIPSSTLTIDNLQAGTHTALSIFASGGADVTVRNSEFADTSVYVTGRVTLDRTIFHNGGPTIYGSAQITNSIFIATPTKEAFRLGYRADLEPDTLVSYSTFVSGSVTCEEKCCTTKYFKDNIFYGVTNITGGTSFCAFEHNLIPASVSLPTGVSSDNTTDDPSLVDPANNNFHLKSNSPAIDSAYTLGIANGHDYDGLSRPQGARPDKGAFEYTPAQ